MSPLSILSHQLLVQLLRAKAVECNVLIGINETKIGSSISDTDIQIEGYRAVRGDRNKWGGSVALFIHESISNYCIRSDLMDNNLELLSIQIKLGTFKPFIITPVYLPNVSVDVF